MEALYQKCIGRDVQCIWDTPLSDGQTLLSIPSQVISCLTKTIAYITISTTSTTNFLISTTRARAQYACIHVIRALSSTRFINSIISQIFLHNICYYGNLKCVPNDGAVNKYYDVFKPSQKYLNTSRIWIWPNISIYFVAVTEEVAFLIQREIINFKTKMWCFTLLLSDK